MIHSKLTPEQENELLLNIILAALTGMMKSGEKVEQDTSEETEGDNHGCMGVDFKYLLNQAIRQYHIPSANWHNTAAAIGVWKSICDKEIYGDYKESIIPAIRRWSLLSAPCRLSWLSGSSLRSMLLK